MSWKVYVKFIETATPPLSVVLRPAMLVAISFGVIVAFIMYVRYFTQPLGQMAQAAQSLQSATAASHRVFEFLEAEEMIETYSAKADAVFMSVNSRLR